MKDMLTPFGVILLQIVGVLLAACVLAVVLACAAWFIATVVDAIKEGHK